MLACNSVTPNVRTGLLAHHQWIPVGEDAVALAWFQRLVMIL